MEAAINNFVMEHFIASVIAISIAVMLLIYLVWEAAMLWSKFKYSQYHNDSKTLEKPKDTSKDKSFDENELHCELHRSKIDTTLLFLTKSVEEMNVLFHQVIRNDNSLTQ
jgi:hypothetical protein